jgi:hypothetical protein
MAPIFLGFKYVQKNYAQVAERFAVFDGSLSPYLQKNLSFTIVLLCKHNSLVCAFIKIKNIFLKNICMRQHD